MATLPRPVVIQGTGRRAELSLDDLRFLAKLEGRPLPRGQALVDLVGLSSSAAYRRIRELKRRGALAFAASVRPSKACECVTYLKVDWAKAGTGRLLEDAIARDPAIVSASRITGSHDYRLVTRHPDFRNAEDWGRRMSAHPMVSNRLTRFCSTVFETSNYAAAILGPDKATP